MSKSGSDEDLRSTA